MRFKYDDPREAAKDSLGVFFLCLFIVGTFLFLFLIS